MSRTERAGGLLERALHASVRGDRAALEAIYAEDVKAWTPALSASSAAELLAELDRRDAAFTDLELETTPLDVAGEFACVEWRVSMTHSGALSLRDTRVPATGLRVTIHGVTVAELDGDRICALRQYWDELALYEQLGLVGDASSDPAP